MKMNVNKKSVKKEGLIRLKYFMQNSESLGYTEGYAINRAKNSRQLEDDRIKLFLGNPTRMEMINLSLRELHFNVNDNYYRPISIPLMSDEMLIKVFENRDAFRWALDENQLKIEFEDQKLFLSMTEQEIKKYLELIYDINYIIFKFRGLASHADSFSDSFEKKAKKTIEIIIQCKGNSSANRKKREAEYNYWEELGLGEYVLSLEEKLNEINKFLEIVNERIVNNLNENLDNDIRKK